MEQINVSLTRQEAELVIKIIRTANLQGNVDTLPIIMRQMVEIMKRITGALEHTHEREGGNQDQRPE